MEVTQLYRSNTDSHRPPTTLVAKSNVVKLGRLLKANLFSWFQNSIQGRLSIAEQDLAFSPYTNAAHTRMYIIIYDECNLISSLFHMSTAVDISMYIFFAYRYNKPI